MKRSPAPKRQVQVAPPGERVDASTAMSGETSNVQKAEFEDIVAIRGLVQYGLPIALAAVTAFGIAGYAVGRAYLEGWYAGAGVSTLTFNWDLQYVVLRGLSTDVIKFWMFLLLGLAGLLVGVSAIESAGGWMDARRANAKKKAAAGSTDGRIVNPHLRKFLRSTLIALLISAMAGVWFFGSQLLLAPKQQGFDDFKSLFARASCLSKGQPAKGDECARPGVRLGLYPWVEIRSPVFATPTRGWLLQQQGGTLLLLSRTGVDLIALGDSPFSVSNAFGAGVEVTPEGLRASVHEGTQFPQFKEEAAVPEGNAGASSPASSSSSVVGVRKEKSTKSSVAVPAHQKASTSGAPVSASAQP